MANVNVRENFLNFKKNNQEKNYNDEVVYTIYDVMSIIGRNWHTIHNRITNGIINVIYPCNVNKKFYFIPEKELIKLIDLTEQGFFKTGKKTNQIQNQS